MTVLLIDFYATYLVSNFKIIYIEAINDDHFLGYCLVANTVTALIGTFVWGWLGDRLGFGKSMLWIVVIDLVFKIIGIFSNSKPALFTLMLLLGFTSRGMQTIAGPGLVEVFGLKAATELLPIKALGVIGPMVCVPILQLIFLNVLTPFQFMNTLILINFFLVASSVYFVRKYGSQG
jgi:MFS family permease